MTKKLLGAFLFIVGALGTQAQNYLALMSEGKQIISMGINASPHLNANADYFLLSRNMGKSIERYCIVAQVNFPVFSQKGFDFDLRIGAGFLLNISHQIKTLAGMSWNFSRTEDVNGRYLHSGFKTEILPGYYSQHWALAAHFSMDAQPWIHIKHSTSASMAFQNLYPDYSGDFKAPKMGWFWQNSLTWQTGMAWAYFNSQWNFNVKAGYQHLPNQLGLEAFPDIGILPFYGSVNVGFTIQHP